jgi:SET domain-containing protein
MSIFVPAHLEIKKSRRNGKGVYVKKHIKKGQLVISLAQSGTISSNVNASKKAIQIDADLYLDPKHHVWGFLNHSCEPNTMFDSENFQIFAIRDIMAGEEITYNYCTTEFDLLAKNEHFSCRCGSKNCIGTISGFKHLPQELKVQLKPYLANYLKKFEW